MINLIPNEEKKKMSKDFYLRFVAILFIMLGISLLIALAAILPSYFFSSVEKKSISMELTQEDNEPISAPDQNTLTAISDLKNRLGLIENVEKNKDIFSKRVIDEIIFKKISGIKITRIFYQSGTPTGRSISIDGIAESREILLLFQQALEADVAFSKVDLPISNFVKGSNIKFSLNLIPS